MTNFNLLTIAERGIIAGAMFFATLSLFVLVLYGVLSHTRTVKTVINCSLFAVLTALTAYVMTAAVLPNDYPLAAPWLWTFAVVVPIVVYSVFALVAEHKRRENVLSPSSVKETLDNLDSGICFSDGNGRTILVNRTMAKISSFLMGSYPQTNKELFDAIKKAVEKGTIEKLDENIYRFPNGKVRRFVTVPFFDRSLSGFTQTTAQEVTEIYNTNEEIRAENERIGEAIEETKKLMARLADRVRERETLALKIKVHNDIGASLLALSQVLTDERGNAEKQLGDLQRAVWHFNTTDVPTEDTLENVKKQARDMGIKLKTEGERIARFEKIILLAAKESVTNCSKHAGGDEVTVRTSEEKDFYTVTITNNGKPPKEKIKEGGGLTSLRQTVENVGGEMKIYHAPEFLLELNLPKGDKNDE